MKFSIMFLAFLSFDHFKIAFNSELNYKDLQKELKKLGKKVDLLESTILKQNQIIDSLAQKFENEEVEKVSNNFCVCEPIFKILFSTESYKVWHISSKMRKLDL